MAPVGLVPVDPTDHVLRRASPEIDVEAVEVRPSGSPVVRVAPDDDALARPVLLDEIRARRGERADTLTARGELRRDGAEERHRGACQKVGRGLREADDKPVSLGDDPARAPASSFQHVLRPDDVLHVLGTGREDEWLQQALDRVSERARADWSAVAEAEALPKGERVGLEIVRDAVPGGDLRLQVEARRGRLVRVRHEPRTGRIEEGPAGLRERKRRVDVVEPGGGSEADPHDPTLLPA